jgi:outer membrane murein-binding lipoprotein Lpp
MARGPYDCWQLGQVLSLPVAAVAVAALLAAGCTSTNSDTAGSAKSSQAASPGTRAP